MWWLPLIVSMPPRGAHGAVHGAARDLGYDAFSRCCWPRDANVVSIADCWRRVGRRFSGTVVAAPRHPTMCRVAGGAREWAPATPWASVIRKGACSAPGRAQFTRAAGEGALGGPL